MGTVYRRQVRFCTTCKRRLDTTAARRACEAYLTGSGANPGRTYDVSPDGQQFLMIREGGADQTGTVLPIIVVQHWTEELKRLVPTRKSRP